MGRIPQGFHENDGTLVSSAFIMADRSKIYMGQDTVSADLYDALQLLNLPVPHDGEYFSGDNADRVFLNTHNLILSVVYRKPPTLPDRFKSLLPSKFRSAKTSVFDACEIVRPDILQPVFSMPLGIENNCRLEIVPGVARIGVVDQKKATEFAAKFKRNGIDFYNPNPEFVGILRAPNQEESLELLVNRRAIRPTAKFLQNDSASAGIQEKIFGGLKTDFEQAFRSASGAEIARVMVECARIAGLDDADRAKILRRHWGLSSSERQKKIAQSSLAYQGSVMEHQTLAA